jgi:hypothetical protein
VHEFGSRHAFGLVALPGLVIALLFFRVKDYKTVELARTVAVEGGTRPVRMRRADIWMRLRVNARLLFAALSTLVSAVLLFAAMSFFHGALQYAVILVMGLTVVSFLPAAAAVTQDVVHPGLRAISYALCVICQNLLGASLGPVVIGALSDRWGIAKALTVLPAFLVVAAALFFAGAFFYQRDLAKVEKVALEIEG